MYTESKFRLDYRNFEELPIQHVDNLDLLNARIRRVEHVKKLEEKITELEMSLTAETMMIANSVLRQNVFPRFGGYSDFIYQSFVTQKTIDEHPTFGNLAAALESTGDDFKDEKKINQMFEFHLHNFIWLFFAGQGVFSIALDDMVVDYIRTSHVDGSYKDSYPSASTYFFTATNAKSGQTYNVEFTFYDLDKAISNYYMASAEKFSRTQRNFGQLRAAEFGRILCAVSKIEKTRSMESFNEGPDKVYIQSFDPLEIAAFIKHEVLEEGNEKNV